MERVGRDPRHRDVLILKVEEDIIERIFGQWSMRTVLLDGTDDLILQAIRIMLENITESHRIIERYTQPAVLQFLKKGMNPLNVAVNKTEQVILFGDIVGFSHLSGLFPVEEVADLVNLYLDISSQSIVEHGGQVTKYVGDCVVAHFPPERADDAVRSCVAILRKIQSLRKEAGQCRLQSFLYCGFGLSKGPVIEGNIGSSIKMDYTVLGDIVNLAARLESLTREIGKALALSEAVKDACQEPWPFICTGEFQLKGQMNAQSIYTIDDPAVSDFMTHQEIIQAASQNCCELPDTAKES
jgi:class 3 adenylate cyclase